MDLMESSGAGEGGAKRNVDPSRFVAAGVSVACRAVNASATGAIYALCCVREESSRVWRVGENRDWISVRIQCANFVIRATFAGNAPFEISRG